MVAHDVVAAVRAYARSVQDEGIPVSLLVLFGSHASGQTNEWSDIDVVVVSPYFDEHREFGASSRLWSITCGHDSRIEPVACGLKEWRDDDGRMLIEIARRKGVTIEIEDPGTAAA